MQLSRNRKEFAVDKVRGKALCMAQYNDLFGVCRIPQPNQDVTVNFGLQSHIAVAKKGQFYVFDVVDFDNDKRLSIEEITKKLEWIEKNCEEAEDGWGALTVNHRDIWAKVTCAE